MGSLFFLWSHHCLLVSYKKNKHPGDLKWPFYPIYIYSWRSLNLWRGPLHHPKKGQTKNCQDILDLSLLLLGVVVWVPAVLFTVMDYIQMGRYLKHMTKWIVLGKIHFWQQDDPWILLGTQFRSKKWAGGHDSNHVDWPNIQVLQNHHPWSLCSFQKTDILRV